MLICIYMMANEAEHHCTSILAIWTSFLEWLLKDYVYFVKLCIAYLFVCLLISHIKPSIIHLKFCVWHKFSIRFIFKKISIHMYFDAAPFGALHWCLGRVSGVWGYSWALYAKPFDYGSVLALTHLFVSKSSEWVWILEGADPSTVFPITSIILGISDFRTSQLDFPNHPAPL